MEGRLRTRKFEAKDKGQKRLRTAIVTFRIQFLAVLPPEKAEVSVLDEPSVQVDSEIPF